MKLNDIEEQDFEQEELNRKSEEKTEKRIEKKAKRIVLFGAPIVAVVLVVVILVVSLNSNSTETVYRETTVNYGDLTVGVTESGAVTVGATEQTFDLDISAFVATGQSTSQTGNIWGAAGGGMGSPMGTETTATTTSSSTRELEIEEIYVSVGEEIEVGTALLKLTDESVESIRSELETDVTSAELTLNELVTSQKTSRLTASHTYESNNAYGTIAQSDYNETIEGLNQTVTDANTSLTEANQDLVSLQEDLAKLRIEYNNAAAAYSAAELALSQTDITQDIYSYVETENLREDAESTKDSLEDELEKLEESIEEQETRIATCESNVVKAQTNLASQTVNAYATYSSRILASENASEIYNVSTAYLDVDLVEAQGDYDEAKEKLDTFDAYIVEGIVLSEYNGVITEIAAVVGNSLSTSETMLSLYDWDDVTILIDVSEDEMNAVALDEIVNITFDAYPDTLFSGKISNIDDAVTDSSSLEVTYPVTVTVQGEVSGLYGGMTGDVTFITKETKEVTYVLNRAIVRTGTKSFVKVKDSNGDIVEKQVTTGFSDGVNVEIIEGLSEGDIVLIESKVSE